jgi:glyoxylase-like metal-dependent hydrolase (beta-lactamase superfamily II)
MTSYINLTVSFLIAALVCVPFNYGHANEVKLPDNLNDVSLAKINDRIYVVHGIQSLPDKHNKGLIGNTGVVLTNSGVVLIDSGGGLEVGRLIVKMVQELTDNPIVAVFNTHIHGDHWLGNAAIREAFPKVRIYAHEIAIKRLQDGEADRWLEIFIQLAGQEAIGTTPVLPNEGLQGGETIEIDGTAFKTHHTGHAHTDSDIMVEAPAQRLLFTGDIVAHGQLSAAQDFNAKGQIEAIRYALELPVDTFVPGHGVTGGREIPQAALRFLEILYDSVKRHYDAGLKDFEMKNKVVNDLAEFSNWFGFDEIGRLISFVYLQVEDADFQ